MFLRFTLIVQTSVVFAADMVNSYVINDFKYHPVVNFTEQIKKCLFQVEVIKLDQKWQIVSSTVAITFDNC